MVSTELVRRLQSAERVAVLTGAGISAESGIPTFRGDDGLWRKFRPEQLATFTAFLAEPDLVWSWYNYRRRIIDECRPNAGHLALVELEALVPTFSLATQNIDGLHRRAGSRDVAELHGAIDRNVCIGCGAENEIAPSTETEGKAPRCGRCGGLVRPDVVWFGEMLPEAVLRSAQEAARSADVYLSIGTSGTVYPAAELPLIARRSGAYTVEINPEPTALSDPFDLTILEPAGVALPALVAALRHPSA